jgi:hypothetical protein
VFDLFRCIALPVSLVGIVVLLIGLSLDAILHLVNPESAHHGGLASLFNPAHLTFETGMALCVVGALLWLLGLAGERGISLLRQVAFAGMASAVSLLAFVSLILAALSLVSDDDSHHAPATLAEQEAATKLVSDTEAGAARFEDFDVAQAEGYEQMKGKRGGDRSKEPFQSVHYINKEYVEDGKVLDPERPEALVYTKTDNGEMKLLGVMYIAQRGEGPTDGGELTQWHTHNTLCMAYEDGSAVVSLKLLGCPKGASPVSEIEMMHVWLFDNPDGPLAPHLKPKDVQALKNSEL